MRVDESARASSSSASSRGLSSPRARKSSVAHRRTASIVQVMWFRHERNAGPAGPASQTGDHPSLLDRGGGSEALREPRDANVDYPFDLGADRVAPHGR